MVASTKRLNLMLHAGAVVATRKEVLAAPTPEPEGRHYPVPHEAVIKEFERSIKGHGFDVLQSAHGLMKSGRRYFGMYEVGNGDNPDDYSLVAGLRNSHDKSFAITVGLGAGVFVCDNLSFSAEFKVNRVHTRFGLRDLPGCMERAIGMLHEARISQDKRFEAYRNETITDAAAHDAIIRVVRARGLAATKMITAVDEWHEPSHEEHTEGGKTAWRLFNAFTEAAKGNLSLLPRRTRVIHGIVDDVIGLKAA